MSLEKAKINDMIYDVISIDEYYSNPDCVTPYTAINNGDGYVYPIRSRTDNRPGFYPTGGLDFFKPPVNSECNMYSAQNIINFREATSLKEIIQCQQRLASAERTVLTTIDNLFAPEIGDNDTPEMAGMKTAIIDKHIDIDKYEPRLGPNFNNDKRLLRKSSITFNKLRSICNALDIRAVLTLEDANSDVPNPIGHSITVDVTGNSLSVDDYEDDDETGGESE